MNFCYLCKREDKCAVIDAPFSCTYGTLYYYLNIKYQLWHF